VWMALALMVNTRLWLAGAVSPHRDLPLIRRLIARVRGCALHRPLLFCTDGLCSSIRAIRETFRDPERTGAHGRTRFEHPRPLMSDLGLVAPHSTVVMSTTALSGISMPAKDARAAWVGSSTAAAHATTVVPRRSRHDR